MDCNQSKLLPTLEGLQLNQIGLVLFGSVAPEKLVLTGFTTICYCLIKLYYILNKTNYITLQAGAHSGGMLLIERKKKKKD
jgi:hypothetical protein